jgi:hypothetical protein
MKHILILAPLALSACIGPFARTSPYAYDKKGELVEFTYAWSAEATANRPISRRLRADLERSFKAAEAAALADRAQAAAANRPFRAHRYARRWTTAGQSARLLSLDGRLTTFTGGASSDHGAEALLWDRTARAEVPPASLFTTNEALDQLVRLPACAKTDCPAPAALALVLADDDHNRRFDHVRLVATHSDREGSEAIELPITATLLAAIKPAYRASFEVAQPQ